jgi:hypothetical protein
MHRKVFIVSSDSCPKLCLHSVSEAGREVANDFKSSETSHQTFFFMQCDERCTKAYFHMGKAHLALKNYSVVSSWRMQVA